MPPTNPDQLQPAIDALNRARGLIAAASDNLSGKADKETFKEALPICENALAILPMDYGFKDYRPYAHRAHICFYIGLCNYELGSDENAYRHYQNSIGDYVFISDSESFSEWPFATG